MTTRGITTKFNPINPEKYIGDPNGIIARSNWELDAFIAVDKMPEVKRWASEEFSIPYIFTKPNGDKVQKKYFPDIYIEFQMPGKPLKVVLVEVKPYKETIPPPTHTKGGKKRPKKTVLQETWTFAMNQSKWKYAEEFCRRKGWVFEKWTEHTLYPNKKKFKAASSRMAEGAPKRMKSMKGVNGKGVKRLPKV